MISWPIRIDNSFNVCGVILKLEANGEVISFLNASKISARSSNGFKFAISWIDDLLSFALFCNYY